jgi:hypothetical protein
MRLAEERKKESGKIYGRGKEKIGSVQIQPQPISKDKNDDVSKLDQEDDQTKGKSLD